MEGLITNINTSSPQVTIDVDNFSGSGTTSP
jgi:hypothetical protein